MDPTENVGEAEDIKINVEITLAELYAGIAKEIEFERTIVCKKCDGIGAKEGVERKDCSICEGRGKVLMNYGFLRAVAPCESCEGKGKVIASEDDNCSECQGEGTILENKKISLPISKGMRYGGLKIPGQGNEARDQISGGVIIFLKPSQDEPSKMKILKQDDLFLLQDISLVDALFGPKFSFTHVDGQKLSLEVPTGTVVSTGDIFKIKGKGMTTEEDGFGDLFVQFNVVLPKNLTDEQKFQLVQVFGQPTKLDPATSEVLTLQIEKTATDLNKEQNDDDVSSDDNSEEGAGGCAQQ